MEGRSRVARQTSGRWMTCAWIAIWILGGWPCLAVAQNLPPPGSYQPIPNYTGVGAGLLFRNAINERFGGEQPISPTIVSLAFSTLPAETDGALVYCKDCQQVNPCTSGGSGAWAYGAQGQWECTAPGTARSGANSDITSLSAVGAMNAPPGGAINHYNIAGKLDPTNPLYGASGSASTLSCTATSGSPTLTGCTVTSGSNDFVNGQHVMVDKAGAAVSCATPAAPTTTVTGSTGTTYTYECAAYDGYGGYSAAGPSATASAAATLDTQSNFVKLTGTNESGAQAYECWGSKDGGTTWYQLERTDDMTYGDFDGNVNLTTFPNDTAAPPSWIPSSPPTAAVNDRLLTTISSGGGTTSITLAANSSYSGTVTVRHDDTSALQAWATALNGAPGGRAYIPAGNYNICGQIDPSTYSTIKGAGVAAQIVEWCGTAMWKMTGGTQPSLGLGNSGSESNFVLYGNNIATSGFTLALGNQADVDHLTLANMDGNALTLDGAQNAKIYQIQMRESLNDLAFAQGSGSAPAGNQMSEMEFSSAWGWYFDDSTTDQHQMNTITDSRIEYEVPFPREPEQVHFNSSSSGNNETWKKVGFAATGNNAGLLTSVVHFTSIDGTTWTCGGCAFNDPAGSVMAIDNESTGLKYLDHTQMTSWTGTFISDVTNGPIIVWMPTQGCSSYSLVDPTTNIDWTQDLPYNSYTGLYMCHGQKFQAPYINSTNGYMVNGAAPSGQYLRGNGSHFVSSAIQSGDLTGLLKTMFAGGSAGTAASTSNAGVIYTAVSGEGGQSGGNGNVNLILPSGTLRNLYCWVSAAPGTSNSYQCTLWSDAGATALTCPISGSATSCTDSTDSVTVNTTQRYSINWTTTVGGSTPSSAWPRSTIELDY